MLCSRLCTALLAATCWLMAAVVSAESEITCESGRNVQYLNCDVGVIRVQTSQYGRMDKTTCSRGRPRRQLRNTHCVQDGTVDVVRRRCDGKKVCEFSIREVRRPDPCFGIYKYLNTTWSCSPAYRQITCDGSVAQLQCAVGQVIFVFGAHYGRLERTTCSLNRPSSQLRNTTCSSPTSSSIVSTRCNGSNRCDIPLDTTVLGDPCPNIYKYLEVAYVCEYPYNIIKNTLPEN